MDSAFANQVVRWVQTPLKTALQHHYQTRTIERLKRQFDLQDTQLKVMSDFVQDENLTYEEIFLERRDIRRMTDGSAEVTVEPKDIVIKSRPQHTPVRLAFFKGPDGEIIELFDNETT